MAEAKINFTGSSFLSGISLSDQPGSAYILSDVRGWDEGPEIDRESVARWNGRGSFVSNRTRVDVRTVEVEFYADLSTNNFNSLMADLSRMRSVRNVSLTITRGSKTERLTSGFISTPATVSRLGKATIVRIVIDFANPYIIDTTSGAERL